MTEILEEHYSVEKISKVFEDNKTTVPIVFATDKNFIPYLYVAIQSLVDNTSKKNNYDIVILYTDVEQYKLDDFKDFISENISVRFYDMSALMEQYKDNWYIHWNYSAAVYYRFFVPELFKDYEKVLYLDGDMIFLSDVVELYNINLDQNYIGAVSELSMNHEKSPAHSYIPSVLKLKNEEYFNAGVLVMNIPKLLEIDFFNVSLSVLKKLGNPIFQDQDVLNVVCNGSVKYLNQAFNVTWNSINFYKNIDKYVSPETYSEFINAVNSPKIFHYCGAYKPWKQPELRYSNYFWKYARKTPYYEEILYSNIMSSDIIKNRIRNVFFHKKIYFNYLKCQFFKKFTSGKKREHYIEKANKLKAQINDYRKTIKG